MAQALLTELESGIDTLGLELPAAAPQQLLDYLELLHRWNKTFNLTAVREPRQMVSKHLLDSLSVLPLIGQGAVVDIGSGAGLPGIPLALARPQQRFVLVDTNGKKTRFMQQAKITLDLDNVEVVHSRVEQYRPAQPFDVVIARAFAATDDILRLSAQLHHGTTRILVMQGRRDENLQTPGYRVAQCHDLQVPGLDAERHLLEIHKQAN